MGTFREGEEMKIEKIILNPFGGLSKELELKEGITTFFGPNEAGKSTIFNAIEKILFTPSNVIKSSTAYKELSKWFPVGGGDTISIGLKFYQGSQKYSLFRSWGYEKRDSLILPTGESINDPQKIKNILEPMLLATEGTYKSVLLTYQSGLSETIQQLKSNRESLNSVGNLIRRSFMETDGVKIEKFKNLIDNKYQEYFKNWDIENNEPIRKKDLSYYAEYYYGELGKAFLDIQKIKGEYEDAKYIEKQLEEKLGNKKKKEEEINKNKEYLEKYETTYQIAKEKERLGKVITEKQKLEQWKDKISDNINLEKQIGNIKIELENKKNDLKNVSLIQKYQKMQNDKIELDSLKKVTKKDIEYLGSLRSELKEIKIKSQSEKISARFTAKKAMDIEVKKGLDGQYSPESIQKDHTIDLDAQGKLTIRHPEWTVEVSAGEQNIGELSTDYQIKEKEMEEYLNNLGVRNFEEAEEYSDKYEKAIITHGNSKMDYENKLKNLGASNLNEIEEQLKEPENNEENKNITTIGETIEKLGLDIGRLKKEFELNKKFIDEIEKEYGDASKIELKLNELEIEYTQINQNISESPKIPEEITNIESFLSEYEKNKDNLTKWLIDLKGLISEYDELDTLEVSSDILEQSLIEKEKNFEDNLNKANAINKVKELSKEILSETSNPDEILIKRVEKYFSFITGGKYDQIVSSEYLPDKIVVNNDGYISELEQKHLSTGTMDALALALRLAMADYLLGNDGFLVMDDPLVAMDPDRQMRAAQLLRDYGKKMQVIVFTCHPTHADMIGGRIDL